ncbi:MAG: acyltransferase [Kangiellaceae bacterium]|nr:acyltransferase [Kangiellaceae bacterium]
MVQGLNSFRFFAFFAVFLFHLDFFEFGYMGVHAFFVLSGFLLTPIIIKMNEHLPTKRYFINFYGRRSLRIFPLYFFYLILISLIAYISIEHFEYDVNNRLARALDQMVYAATYTYNFFAMSSSYEQTQTVTHFWSLAVEEQFYLIWPFVIYLIHKSSVKRALLIIIVSGPMIRFLLAQLVMVNNGAGFNDVDMVVYSFTLSNFDAFAIGGYFALYGKNTSNLKILAMFLALVVIGFVTDYMSGVKFDLRSFGYSSFMKDSYKYIWAFSLFSTLFALILVNIRDKVFLPIIFENKIIAYLGKISYGLYVYHFPLVYFVGHELSHISFYVRAPIILALTIIISVLSYHLLEQRFLDAKDKLFPH